MLVCELVPPPTCLLIWFANVNMESKPRGTYKRCCFLSFFVDALWPIADLWLQEAEKMGKAPDFVYCKELLENTGIVTVPGSGFRQASDFC